MLSRFKGSLIRFFTLAFLILMPVYAWAATDTTEKKATVSADAAVGIREAGTVANIKIEELKKGSLVNSAKAQDRVITLTLMNSKYEFENAKPVVTPNKGFSGMKGITTAYGKVKGQADKQVIHIYLPQRKNITLQGAIAISQINVKALSKEVKPGNIEIEVSGLNVKESVVTVGEIKDYGITVANKLSEPVKIKTGGKNNISFSFKENVVKSILPKKTVEVTLDKGYFSPKDNAAISDLTIGSIKLNDQDITKQLVLKAIQKDGFLIGFSFDLPSNLDNTKYNAIAFSNLQVYAPTNEPGEMKVFVNAAGLKDQVNAVVAVIKAPATVSAEPFKLKVGLKDQLGGKAIITETDKNMIEKGIIELEIEKQEGISYEEVPTVTVVSGDIKLGETLYDEERPYVLTIEVLNPSKVASVIEIKGFAVTVGRMVPDGGYKLIVKGSAITPDTTFGQIESADFMIVGEVQAAPKK